MLIKLQVNVIVNVNVVIGQPQAMAIFVGVCGWLSTFTITKYKRLRTTFLVRELSLLEYSK